MKTKTITLLILLGLLLAGLIDVQETYDPHELIRFHVLANSDSDADQALKLAVKDQVVTYMQTLLDGAEDVQDSRQIIQSHLPDIKQQAQLVLDEKGSSEGVTVEYGHFDFPVKYYGQFSLPAGNYEALRVVIGEGEGHNWWCVLFPPMCFVDAADVAPDELAHYTDQSPEKKVVLKCRLTEWLAK